MEALINPYNGSTLNLTPFFSIIIPTFNRADFIAKTIQSFLNQTFKNFEIIVVDNDSIDDTENTIRNFNDTRISYFKKINERQTVARNYGAKKATGKYINFFDSDDIAYPNHLQSAYDFIKENNKPEIFHQNYDERNFKGITVRKPTRIVDINRQLCNGNLLSINGVFLKKEIALQYPFYENPKLIGSEDYLLWLQLASRYKFHNNPVSTSAYIHHSNNSVLGFSKDALIQRKELMLNYVFEDKLIMQYYGKNISRLKSTTYFYAALHLMMMGCKKEGTNYLMKGLKETPELVFTKRFIVILKYFLL